MQIRMNFIPIVFGRVRVYVNFCIQLFIFKALNTKKISIFFLTYGRENYYNKISTHSIRLFDLCDWFTAVQWVNCQSLTNQLDEIPIHRYSVRKLFFFFFVISETQNSAKKQPLLFNCHQRCIELACVDGNNQKQAYI